MYGSAPHTTTAPPGREPRAARPSFVARHDAGSTARLSTTVVHALADAMGADVTDAERSLRDRVDPAALDLLFPDSHGRSPGHVAFSVRGYRTTVYSSGEIVIDPPAR